MGIPVKLQVFEGPLDLLLHLIDKNKIDIYDIPIVEITNQYMDYIKAMEKEDLNVMSEFLVMAATLLDIKCRMLLPKEVNEEGEEEDPRQELVEQLLEYKMYKYASYELKDMELDAEKAYFKSATIPKEVNVSPSLIHRLSLDTPDSEWAKEILSSKPLERREEGYKIVEKAGFDIKSVSREMEEFYLSL